MKNKIILVAVINAALGLSGAAQAVEVAGETLNVYGKLHMSVDFSDSDGLAPTKGSNISISSNSSRLGFKGQHGLDNGMAVIWQVETEVKPDETGATLAGRNSYAGIKGDFGIVLVGHYDTPLKTVGTKWGIFGDSVGERRAILGASATGGNQLNQRGKNALLYKNTFAGVELQAMYATDAQDSTKGKGLIDNNDNDMTSVSLSYNEGPLSLALAQESWSALSGGEVDALRVAAKYTVTDMLKLGAIYESIEGTASVSDHLSRDVMGVNAAYKVMPDTTLKFQYLSAGDYDTVANSGATKLAVGVFKKMDKQTELYLAYASTRNDANAEFQAVDGGHGDEVKTVSGGSPSSFSAGLVYKF